MFKRLFWLTMGLAVGFGTSLWLSRMVRETMARYAPERIGDDMAGALRALRTDVRTALAEGRQAMRQAEADLRDDIGARR